MTIQNIQRTFLFCVVVRSYVAQTDDNVVSVNAILKCDYSYIAGILLALLLRLNGLLNTITLTILSFKNYAGANVPQHKTFTNTLDVFTINSIT